jgi:hypothetical protein
VAGKQAGLGGGWVAPAGVSWAGLCCFMARRGVITCLPNYQVAHLIALLCCARAFAEDQLCNNTRVSSRGGAGPRGTLFLCGTLHPATHKARRSSPHQAHWYPSGHDGPAALALGAPRPPFPIPLPTHKR